MVDVQKHCKIGVAALLRHKKAKNLILSGYSLGQVCCNIKMANLPQIIDPDFSAQCFFKRNVLKHLLFIVLIDKQG